MQYIPKFQKLALFVLKITYGILYKIEVVGRENIPDGGCLVCGNHPSLNDPVFVALAITSKYEVTSMGKKEMFDKKLLGMLLTALGGFPVDRGKTDMKAIKSCFKAIEDGKKLIIFPEGTRSENSKLKAKAGVGLIAKKLNCPIVPVHINDTPKWFGKVKLTIGTPIYPPAREEKISNEQFAQSILDHILTLGENKWKLK